MTFDASWDGIHQFMEWGQPPDLGFMQFCGDNWADADLSGMHFVDLGCATGAQTVWLASKGAKVTAIDASPAVIKRLAARVKQDLPDSIDKVTLLLGDFADLDLEPQSVDCVIDVCGLQCVPLEDAHTVMDRAKNWFKPKKGVVYSKAAPSDFDLRYSRSEYIRLSDETHIDRIFDGYNHCTTRVGDIMCNGAAVVHFVTIACPASSLFQQFKIRI